MENPMGDGQPSVSVLLALGKLHREAGNAAEAKRFLTAVLTRDQTGPIAGEAYTTLGLIYRAEGLREAATSFFRHAETAAPGAGVTRDIADLLFENGDYRDAIKEYTQLSGTAAGDTERQYFDSRIILAMIRNGEGPNAEKSIAAFNKKYGDAQNDVALFELEKGLLQFRREEYPGAMKALQHVADKFEDSPSGPTAMYWIGKTLEATEKPREAIEHLENLLASHPQAPVIMRVHLALGNLYYGAEKWDQAIKHYRIVIDDPHPDQELVPSAMSNLIETYEVAAAYDGALTLTRRYLELYPNAEDALDKKIKIGMLYDHLGYYDQASLHLQSLLDEAGSDLEGEIRYYIAEANYHKGDYQQAILDFLKVPYLVTKKGKIDWTANSLYMSGQSYEKMGRYDQALTMYQQIVDRAGIDETFKSAARKEIDRVRTVLKKKPG
jgi:tetratricopeptide (TPR) repeat protein